MLKNWSDIKKANGLIMKLKIYIYPLPKKIKRNGKKSGLHSNICIKKQFLILIMESPLEEFFPIML